jgi:hypothetical protein
VHTATAELLGIPAGSIKLAIDGLDTATIPDKMKPILRYARKLSQQPTGQADADAIFAAGWDETALYHTVAVTALFNFMNRLEGLGIELDPAYVKLASERLAKGGYLPLIALMSA